MLNLVPVNCRNLVEVSRSHFLLIKILLDWILLCLYIISEDSIAGGCELTKLHLERQSFNDIYLQ